jgi:hypothetical protein
MTYPASLKDLFHSDWLGAAQAASPIGPQLGERETGKSDTPPRTANVSYKQIWHFS